MNIDKPSSMWRQPEVLISIVTLAVVAIVCMAFQYANLQRKVAVDNKTAAIVAKMQEESKRIQVMSIQKTADAPVVAIDDSKVEPANNND